MLGRHTIKHWSSTQTSVALSSGEAEFNGVIRGAGQGLGYTALLQDFGVDVPLRLWTDSSAAIGICSRQGLGKLRHLDTHTLWIQQAVRNRRIDLRKVDGAENPADLLTKHSLSRDRFLDLVGLYECQYRDGRAESAPQLRTSDSSKATMASGTCGRMIAPIEGGPEGQEEEMVEEVAPWIPHLALSDEDIDRRFPSLVAPDDEGLDDIIRDEDDAMLQHGIKMANDISENMLKYGRTRRDCGELRL